MQIPGGLQLHVPLFLVERVINSPHRTTTLVELHTYKALVKREVVPNCILQWGGRRRGGRKKGEGEGGRKKGGGGGRGRRRGEGRSDGAKEVVGRCVLYYLHFMHFNRDQFHSNLQHLIPIPSRWDCCPGSRWNSSWTKRRSHTASDTALGTPILPGQQTQSQQRLNSELDNILHRY